MGIKQIWVVEPETGDWWKFINGEIVTEPEFVLHGRIIVPIHEIALELD